MKKILFRKLLFDCLQFFLITIIGISAIVWVFQAVNYLDILVEDGRNYLVYFKYTILSLPKIIGKIFPFALFLSLFYVITKYEDKNELIIFWTHGISKLEVINFFFKFSLIITLFQIFFLTLVVPNTEDLTRSTLRNSSINFFDNFLKPKKFNDIIKNVTIYSESKNNSGLLKNIYIKKNFNSEDFEITYSKSGIIKTINGTQIFVLYDGQNIKGKKGNLNIISFTKSDFNLSNLESNTTTYKKIQENSSFDLIRCYQSLHNEKLKNNKNNVFQVENCKLGNSSTVLGELYKRIYVPLYIPIFILIIMLSFLVSKENRNYLKKRILIFLIGFFAIIFSEITTRFVQDTLKENFILNIIPLMFLITLYLIIYQKLRIKKIIK